MVVLSRSNLFSAVRVNVVSLISDNVSDPLSSSSEFRDWIYSRRPDVKASDFGGYPFIVVPPVDVDLEKKSSFDGKSKRVSWDVEIEIVTSAIVDDEGDGDGLSMIESISDDVLSVFLDRVNRLVLRGQLMNFSTPVSSPVSNDVISDELVFVRSIMLSFNSKLQVSS